MGYTVHLIYFRQTGKYLIDAKATIERDNLVDIWAEVDDMRRMGRLPGLRPGAGRDLFVLVDVPDHPQRVLHITMPPFQDEDDVTPLRVPTGEMVPLVRVPLAEIPRTTTRDIVQPSQSDHEPDTVVASDEEVTPVEHRIPRPPDGSTR